MNQRGWEAAAADGGWGAQHVQLEQLQKLEAQLSVKHSVEKQAQDTLTKLIKAQHKH